MQAASASSARYAVFWSKCAKPLVWRGDFRYDLCYKKLGSQEGFPMLQQYGYELTQGFKKTCKRALSLALTLALVFSLLPTLTLPAHAAGEINVSTLEELRAAIISAPNGTPTTIVVTAPIDIETDSINIGGGKNITLTGERLTLRDNGVRPTSVCIYLTFTCSLTLENITIDGDGSNYDSSHPLIYAAGTLTMNSGAVLQNHTYADITNGNRSWGGAVQIKNNSEFIMNGGAITGNSAANGGEGGGVYIESGGSFIMTGGEISGNTATLRGGGVYVANGGSFTVGGTAKIINNTVNGVVNNVEFANNRYLTLGTGGGAPAPGMQIGVTKTADEGVIVASGATEADAGYFTADAAAKTVAYYENTLKIVDTPLFSGGDGTPGNPYIITTAAGLDAVRDDLAAHYKLGNDINLEDEPWTPIGTPGTGNQFTGIFDGAGYTISGLYINLPITSNVGLFGYVGTGGTVKNLSVNGSVSGHTFVGGVVGYNGGTVENCYNIGDVSGNESVGGVVGNNGATVSYSRLN